MKLFTTVSALQEALSRERIKDFRIGFVPTMGALHEGHISLVKRAEGENDIVVVSIFVNPTQFNDKADLERYPRTLEADLEKLRKVKVDYVFAPSTKEIYPEQEIRNFNFGHLETVMEGQYRPGHFNGVAQVVSILFDIVKPGKAYFGQKDFQQLTIIKELVRQLSSTVEVIPCEIVREADGLAMSSRNILLEQRYRDAAPIIYKTLQKVDELKEGKSVEEVKEIITAEIEKEKLLKVEYFEIVREDNLLPVTTWREDATKVACIAVYAGKIRLIDNVRLKE